MAIGRHIKLYCFIIEFIVPLLGITMATPPPLPPNRPIRQRSSNSEQYVNTREKQPATPTTPSPSPSSLKPHGAVGPRHSWTSTGMQLLAPFTV